MKKILFGLVVLLLSTNTVSASNFMSKPDFIFNCDSNLFSNTFVNTKSFLSNSIDISISTTENYSSTTEDDDDKKPKKKRWYNYIIDGVVYVIEVAWDWWNEP